MSDNNLPIYNDNKGYITIPCPGKSLGEFISNLLTRPGSISNKFRVVFDLDKNFIETLNTAIITRLSQQNNYEVISFTAEVQLEDGRIRDAETL